MCAWVCSLLVERVVVVVVVVIRWVCSLYGFWVGGVLRVDFVDWLRGVGVARGDVVCCV